MDTEIKHELKKINKRLKRYNKLLELHIRRTEAIEKWVTKHDGASQGRFSLIRESGIIVGIGLVLARVFGII